MKLEWKFPMKVKVEKVKSSPCFPSQNTNT